MVSFASEVEMDADTLSLIAGTVLSLFFSYIPGLNQKFDALPAEAKRLIMLGLVVLVAGAVYALACAELAADLGIAVTCDKAGGVALVRAVILAAIANQGTYGLTKRK